MGYPVRRPAASNLHRPIVELFLHRNVWAKGVGRGLTCTPDVFVLHVRAFQAYFSLRESCLLNLPILKVNEFIVDLLDVDLCPEYIIVSINGVNDSVVEAV